MFPAKSTSRRAGRARLRCLVWIVEDADGDPVREESDLAGRVGVVLIRTQRIEFAQSFLDGVKDASSHIEATAASCPKTRIVLGGYSQGAAVAAGASSASVPAGVPAEYLSFMPKPMPPEIANHVAAVTLFGKPSPQWLQNYGAPLIVVGPLYAPKTDDLCADGDTICNGDPGGLPSLAHSSYPVNGMVGQAAGFAASHL